MAEPQQEQSTNPSHSFAEITTMPRFDICSFVVHSLVVPIDEFKVKRRQGDANLRASWNAIKISSERPKVLQEWVGLTCNNFKE